MAKEMIAMILAGGQGSRLYALTQKLAKPAVPFGGKYRIIDFPLSNCVNSDIDTVGILTQYQPLVLNEYIGNGQPWDLDRLHGGVHVLPPYQQASGSDWYKGTANAIYQNLSFIDRYDPKYVIILSGDQICKQDYSDFLRFHKEKDAEFSVAVMEVPWSEASRFGLMVTDENDKINLSLQDVGGSLLLVPQFTLYADCRKGNRPNFIQAAKPDEANRLYEYFVEYLRSKGFHVETGSFGADMKVELLNDGPFTLILDSDTLIK